MRSVAFVLALLLLPQSAQTQVTIVAPGSQGQPGRASDKNYGPPRVVELDDIVMGDGYLKAHVITEGEVDRVQDGQGPYWILRQGRARVLIIPGRDFDAGELEWIVGKRTEARGIVRLIREKRYVGNPKVDLDLIEDPILPPMPAPNFAPDAPRYSLTVFAMRDRTSVEFNRGKETSGGIGRQILDEPSAYSGKTTKIYGQFRGRNLLADLPASSARGKDDWVLKDGDTAIWVTGKMPKGEGWKLDLDYKGDTRNWLEVEGKPEVVNGIVYLKASLVLRSKPPAAERPERPRP